MSEVVEGTWVRWHDMPVFLHVLGEHMSMIWIGMEEGPSRVGTTFLDSDIGTYIPSNRSYVFNMMRYLFLPCQNE